MKDKVTAIRSRKLFPVTFVWVVDLLINSLQILLVITMGLLLLSWYMYLILLEYNSIKYNPCYILKQRHPCPMDTSFRSYSAQLKGQVSSIVIILVHIHHFFPWIIVTFMHVVIFMAFHCASLCWRDQAYHCCAYLASVQKKTSYFSTQSLPLLWPVVFSGKCLYLKKKH